MSQMKSIFLIPAAVALMGVSAGAWAADDDGAEATIRLMDTAEAELPDAVTKTISLPEHLRLQSTDQAATVDKAKGHDKANERLDNEKRNSGLAKANAARENGAEMSEKAKEARENQGRAKEDRPDPPNRPDNPNRP
jgi:hypothetical protein